MRKVIQFLSVALFAVGCSRGAQPSQVSISFMHGWGGNGTDHLGMRQIYADFEARNPDIQLISDALPDLGIVMDKANDMLSLGRAPNIISTNGNAQYLTNAIKKGTALDLAPFLLRDADFASDVSPLTIDALSDEQGHLYSLPDAMFYIGYWYNEDLFRQAGITDTGTRDGTVLIPQTWDEFWQACDKLYAARNETGAVPVQIHSDQLRFLFTPLLAAENHSCRSFLQHRSGQCTEADAKKALEGVHRLMSYDEEEPQSSLDVRQGFFDGKSAIYINGVWANTDLDQTGSGQKIKYAPFPSDTGESIAYVHPTSGYVLSAEASDEQIEAGIRFLKYILSEEVQKRIVKETRQAPANPKISMEWMRREAPVLAEAMRVCTEADVHIISLDNLDFSPRSAGLLEEYFKEMVQGKDVDAKIITLFR